MIAIAQEGPATWINAFSCGPQNQPRLIDSWIRATEERLGKLADIIWSLRSIEASDGNPRGQRRTGETR